MGSTPLPEERSRLGRSVARLGRHVAWAQRDGLGRLIEEDQLDPVARVRVARSKRAWVKQHGQPPGSARAVLVVGVQRSGTNMLTRGLESLPEVEVRNENDRRVFDRFQLRSVDVVVETTRSSRHEVVLFKPICDSHRTGELLDALAAHTPSPRALWAFRRVDARARSAVAKFGDVNLRIVRRILADEQFVGWQSAGLVKQDRQTLLDMEPDSWDEFTGAAAFWWLRNRLYFTTGLAEREDVLPVSYEQVVSDPEGGLAKVAEFLDLPARSEMWRDVEGRDRLRVSSLDLHPGVRRLCRELEHRLESAATDARR